MKFVKKLIFMLFLLTSISTLSFGQFDLTLKYNDEAGGGISFTNSIISLNELVEPVLSSLPSKKSTKPKAKKEKPTREKPTRDFDTGRSYRDTKARQDRDYHERGRMSDRIGED